MASTADILATAQLALDALARLSALYVSLRESLSEEDRAKLEQTYEANKQASDHAFTRLDDLATSIALRV